MNPTAAPIREVCIQLEAMREKLLDLSLRNRMLNYRPSRRLGISFQGEDTFEIHRMMVEEGKKMSFDGVPDPPRKRRTDEPLPGFDDEVVTRELRQAAEEELDAYLKNPVKAVDQMDTKLQTTETASVLPAKLRTILREAGTAAEELGINTLFVTLGILEWSEGPGEKACRAPLIFVPVKLERQNNGTIKMQHDGGDVGGNHPLAAKMAKLNLKFPDYDEEKSLATYFDEVESTIRGREDWVVHRNEMFLDFFSYEKYVMHQDLGGDAWPEGQKPWEHPDIVAMLGPGYADVASSVTDRSFIDDARPVAVCHEIFDADSSQSLVIIRANEGHSFIVEGPPGTGKSQTIANLIAESVAAGRRVLFVSSKRAALDVVKRRLEEAGLGAMCLVMHDKLTNRREFYAELKRTVGLSLSLKSEEERVARLTELRSELNNHSKAVNEPIEPFGVTPFNAMCRLAALPRETAEDREGRIAFEALQGWSEREFRAKLPAVGALLARIREIGTPVQHPFWNCGIEYVDPGRRLDLQEDLAASIEGLARAQEAFTAACAALSVSLPATLANAELLVNCAERARSAPPHEGMAANARVWAQQESAIRAVVAALREREEIRQRRLNQLAPAGWQAPVAPLAQAYEAHAASFFRILNGEFRRAQATVAPWLTPSSPGDPLGIRDLLREAARVQTLEREIADMEGEMRRLFGAQWRGLESSPATLEGLLEWILQLESAVQSGALPSGLLDFLSGTGSPEDAVAKAQESQAKLQSAVSAVQKAVETLQYGPFDPRTATLDEMAAKVRGWRDNLPALAAYIAFAEARRQALALGLEAVVAVADRWSLAGDRLSASLERSYYEGVIRLAMQRHPSLRSFERERHQRSIKEFRDLDNFKLEYNRAQVRLAHLRQLPRFESALGNLQLLKVQCELQRKQKPIRWVMARAGEAIQRIKPVFMMSPLSVAIHLPPELPPFDLVVFDEASQIKPEDALSSIIRAKQSIVVGDTKQLPPTSFFDRIDDDDEPLEEVSEDLESAREMAKLESVLSLMSAVTFGNRRPDLRWHYRSLHEGLIAPSNELFYGSRLVVFPSAKSIEGSSRVGLVFHHLTDAIYESGSTKRVNRKEAETIAAAVVQHMREHPDQSLMVAAMNKPQADLIWALVQHEEARHPDLFDAYRQRHPFEALDVKNLENVQGDERDVVFVSITYGRDENGVIRQNFGPILKDGGDRRLNVLFTRSKVRCEVFSNLRAGDIRADAHQTGVLALKSYLSAAETGSTGVPAPTGGLEESPFEEEVGRKLRERGYEVHCQVGSIGYRIDLAIVDPKNPGNYLLGIECDGATYHSAQSARDRDKLHQQVLERRGWRLHRIWSRDWWQDPEGEILRVIDAIEGDSEKDLLAPPIQVRVQELEEAPAAEVKMPSYTVTPPRWVRNEVELNAYVQLVVDTEGPIAKDLLIERLRQGVGKSMPHFRSAEAWDRVLNVLTAQGVIRMVRDAYVSRPQQVHLVRDRSELPAGERRLSRVSDQELISALVQSVKGAYGIEPKDALRAALRLLGFKRVTDEATSRGEALIKTIVATGELEDREGLLYC